MTQEDKELLMKDLCARLPYGVKISKVIEDFVSEHRPIRSINLNNIIVEDGEFEDGTPDIDVWNYEEIKPYLFPLSSMTEEQINDCPIGETTLNIMKSNIGYGLIEIPWRLWYMFIDWCNKNHFDYRGLIPMGMAIDATGLNIY